MKWTYLFLFVLLSSTAAACGGRNIALQGEVTRTSYSKQYATSLAYEHDKLLLDKEMVRYSKKDADGILEQYLAQEYPGWESYAFESFDLEHGRIVYMYSAHVPEVAISYHVGPVQFTTDHLHFHVDAVTGELYDVGCGGAPSKVVARGGSPQGNPEWSNILPQNQTYFYTEFLIPEGAVPTLDGMLQPGEWDDAYKTRIHVGSAQDTVTAYGCGGSGKRRRASGHEVEVEIRSKLSNGTVYFAVQAQEPRWIGVLFKDFPHHGMIGDFGDVKILSAEGIQDYYLSSDKADPSPMVKVGKHGCYGYAKLYPDEESNVRGAQSGYVYEFAFPLDNADPGDTHWKVGEAYQIALLYGDGPVFNGLTESTAMSAQETIRLKKQRSYAFVTHNPSPSSHDHDADHHQQGWWQWITAMLGWTR